MPSKSKAKGNRFEYEVVAKLEEMGYKNVRRSYGSNGLSLPDCAEDVDILVGGSKDIKPIKIQCKVRKTIPKWLSIGTCDWVAFKEDRGEIFIISRLKSKDKRIKKKGKK